MEDCRWKRELKAYLPRDFFAPLWALGEAQAEGLEEIRIRAGKPLQLIGNGYERMLEDCRPDALLMRRILEALSEHSAYLYERERRAGFFTLPGGYRVGLSGRRGPQGDMACVSGCCIRIAREWKGCADALLPHLLDAAGRPLSSLLLSAPGVGKTTMLRDLARQFSDGGIARVRKLAVADERGEIAGCRLGIPTLDVGRRTDVMDAYPKAEAIGMLLRSMSPDLILTDEVGGMADMRALREAGRCGVSVVASAHAPDLAAAKKRAALSPLLRGGLFERVVELYREEGRVAFRVA